MALNLRGLSSGGDMKHLNWSSEGIWAGKSGSIIIGTEILVTV